MPATQRDDRNECMPELPVLAPAYTTNPQLHVNHRVIPTQRTAKRRRIPRARGFRRGLAPARTGAAAVSERDRQVQRSPGVELRVVRPMCRGLPARGPRPPQGLSSRHPPVRLPLHRAGLRRERLVLHRRVSAEGPLALRQSGLRNDGRLPLDARPAGEQLGNGRDGLAAGQAPGERDGGVRRRVRPPAVPLPQGRKREQYPFAGTARRVAPYKWVLSPFPPCGARTSPRRCC